MRAVVDAVALWIGYALMIAAALGVLSIALYALMEVWWRSIGRNARLIILYWVRDRARDEKNQKVKGGQE